VKARWDAGDKSGFYPYGVKSMERTLLEMAGAVDRYAGDASASASPAASTHAA
jgi:hypothetical protein